MAIKNKIFVFNDQPFMRVVPSKSLFHSSTVHEVVNRGDFFAVNLSTNELTILKGGSDAVATDWPAAEVAAPKRSRTRTSARPQA